MNNVTNIDNRPQRSTLFNIHSTMIIREQTDISHYEIHIRIYILR